MTSPCAPVSKKVIPTNFKRIFLCLIIGDYGGNSDSTEIIINSYILLLRGWSLYSISMVIFYKDIKFQNTENYPTSQELMTSA